ncbi:MAG: hypothetical protein IJV08_11485 [Bacteroidaceae bacterium]|nr:hypothetical protein [Bacteroidaceae bacterium]MBR1449521.1 hypothetical protein [Prevotella sp.]
MKAKTSITIKGEPVEFTLDTKRLDRNYPDENYAYWIQEDKFGFFHEVNINKADDGSFKATGIVNTWFDLGRFEDAADPDCVSDVTFTFSDEKNSLGQLSSLISRHAYAELRRKVADSVGDEPAPFIFPAVARALEGGGKVCRELILIDWLDVDSMRVCTNCGAIMEQGWLMGDMGYACSDECAAQMEGITMEQFRKWRIYKDDIIEYLRDIENEGRQIEDLTQEECDAIIGEYCADRDYFWTEWY